MKPNWCVTSAPVRSQPHQNRFFSARPEVPRTDSDRSGLTMNTDRQFLSILLSVKGLTQVPDVRSQMATNLSWTSALGVAYYNIPQDALNAVQVMRQRAQQGGNLKSNSQQNVTVEKQPPAAAPPAATPQPIIVHAPPQTIVIQPGVFYQQVLGGQTADIATAMQECNPASGWERVD
jgi:hypothetical protein